MCPLKTTKVGRLFCASSDCDRVASRKVAKRICPTVERQGTLTVLDIETIRDNDQPDNIARSFARACLLRRDFANRNQRALVFFVRDVRARLPTTLQRVTLFLRIMRLE
jgi:hypothetical protein